MRYELDDPVLTAYALGELEGEEKSAVEAQVAECDETRRTVDEIRAAAFVLSDELRKEANTWSLQELWRAVLTLREKASSMVRPRVPQSRWAVAGMALAASLVVGMSVVAILWPKLRNEPTVATNTNLTATQPTFRVIMAGSTDGSSGATGPAGGATFDARGLMHRSFQSVAQSPVSSFALSVKGESYADVRSAIERGRLPAAGAVRIEEMINAFSYRHEQPKGDETIAAGGEVAPCPWNQGHKLVRVGIAAREWTGPTTAPSFIASNVKAQVEFNPVRVASFRLLGYETPAAEGADGSKGEELRPGQAVTALYEVVPAQGPGATAYDGLKYQSPPQPTSAARSDELVTVKVSYTAAGTNSPRTVAVAIADKGGALDQASEDLRFAAAVAEFGMVLRDSPHKGSASFDSVVALASGAKGDDRRRAEFGELVQKAAAIARKV